MEKAYDLKVLGEKLKARGMDIAEESAKVIVQETFAWIKESAPISATPYDDMAMLVMPKLEEVILSGVDKIDGQVG